MAERSAKQLGLSKADLPNSVIEVIATLTKSGFEAYLVGGGVRDTLLGLKPKDFDAVTDAKPHEIKDLFGKRCRVIGRRFQLAHVYSGRDMIEVATFRAPPNGDAHTTSDGMIVRDNVWGDIEQDFARRDFSINALYYQPLKGIVHDFCDALDDIKSQTLRLLGNAPVRIEEDPVRLLRALRFKAKLGFEFDQALSDQFHDDNWALLDQVSPHRLYDESQKMFTGGYLVPLLPLLFEYGAIRHLIIYPPAKPTPLVKQVAINTDKRIAQGKSINPAFFYAALLWDNYLYQLDRNKQKNMPFHDAQLHAASKVIDRQRIKTAIPKFAEQFIRDIWLMQPKLANPRAKQIVQLAEHPRFRAAFDFLLLRELCDDVANPLSESTNGMGDWWQTYQTLSEKQKQRAIDEFAKDSRRGPNKRSRNRNRNKVPDSAEEPVTLESSSANTAKSAHHQPSQDTTINKSNRRARSSRGQESHYARERAQLQKLSLGEVAGEQTADAQQPQPLFTINAEKMAKQVPQQAAIAAQPTSVPHQSSTDNSTASTDEQSPQTDTSSSRRGSSKSKSAAARQAEVKPSATQAANTEGLQVVGNALLLPKEDAVPSRRRRRQPSSSITQAERMAGVTDAVDAGPGDSGPSDNAAAATKKPKKADKQASAANNQPVVNVDNGVNASTLQGEPSESATTPQSKPRRQRKKSVANSEPSSQSATSQSATSQSADNRDGSDNPPRSAKDQQAKASAQLSELPSEQLSGHPPVKRSRKKAVVKEKGQDNASSNVSTDQTIDKPAAKSRANAKQSKQSQQAQTTKSSNALSADPALANDRVPASRRRRAPSSDKSVSEQQTSKS